MISREVQGHARAPVLEATDLPVSADLEKGSVTRLRTPRLLSGWLASSSLVGGSIEDATGRMHRSHRCSMRAWRAITRIAAVEAARTWHFPFALTARAEGFLRGNPDLDDVIRRLQSFREAAGADVLMGPGLPDLAAVRTVCSALSKPFNFMAGIRGKSFSVPELGAAGVKRIQPGHIAVRAAMTGLLKCRAQGEGEGDSGLRRYYDGDYLG